MEDTLSEEKQIDSSAALEREDPFAGIEFANPIQTHPEIEEKIQPIIKNLQDAGVQVSSRIRETFADPELFAALPEALRQDTGLLESYIGNTAKFDAIIHTSRTKANAGESDGLLGEEVTLPPSTHADGRDRREEIGKRLQLETLSGMGIDPKRVLFFRLTQPSESPKPEYYWTSDYREVTGGLQAEVSGEARRSSVILVSDLETINGNGGLIQDVNDDSGISVRQINRDPFDQKRALATIHPAIFTQLNQTRSELQEIGRDKL